MADGTHSNSGSCFPPPILGKNIFYIARVSVNMATNWNFFGFQTVRKSFAPWTTQPAKHVLPLVQFFCCKHWPFHGTQTTCHKHIHQNILPCQLCLHMTGEFIFQIKWCQFFFEFPDKHITFLQFNLSDFLKTTFKIKKTFWRGQKSLLVRIWTTTVFRFLQLKTVPVLSYCSWGVARQSSLLRQGPGKTQVRQFIHHHRGSHIMMQPTNSAGVSIRVVAHYPHLWRSGLALWGSYADGWATPTKKLRWARALPFSKLLLGLHSSTTRALGHDLA